MTIVTTPDVQTVALQQAIAQCAASGWQLQTMTPGMAVMRSGEGTRTNHVLHALLSLLTCGLWLIVWLALVMFSGSNREKTLLITVDAAGNVSYQPSR